MATARPELPPRTLRDWDRKEDDHGGIAQCENDRGQDSGRWCGSGCQASSGEPPQPERFDPNILSARVPGSLRGAGRCVAAFGENAGGGWTPGRRCDPATIVEADGAGVRRTQPRALAKVCGRLLGWEISRDEPGLRGGPGHTMASGALVCPARDGLRQADLAGRAGRPADDGPPGHRGGRPGARRGPRRRHGRRPRRATNPATSGSISTPPATRSASGSAGEAGVPPEVPPAGGHPSGARPRPTRRHSTSCGTAVSWSPPAPLVPVGARPLLAPGATTTSIGRRSARRPAPWRAGRSCTATTTPAPSAAPGAAAVRRRAGSPTGGAAARPGRRA